MMTEMGIVSLSNFHENFLFLSVFSMTATKGHLKTFPSIPISTNNKREEYKKKISHSMVENSFTKFNHRHHSLHDTTIYYSGATTNI